MRAPRGCRGTPAPRIPALEVHPVCADFTRPFMVPEGAPFDNRMIYFPGSTIGNFERHEAIRLLCNLRRVARGG